MAMRGIVVSASSMLMVVGIVVLAANLSGISAQSECGGDVQLVIQSCKEFIGKEGPQTKPSQECCDALKDVDVPSLCQKYITPPVEQYFSVEKALFVAQSCGRPVPSELKCGSVTVPLWVSASKPQK